VSPLSDSNHTIYIARGHIKLVLLEAFLSP